MRIPDLRRVFRVPTRAVEKDVDRELRFHIDSRVAELVAEGRTRDEAREIAIREFGDVDAVRRVLVDMDAAQLDESRRAELFDELRQDAGFAVRTLRARPGFAIAAMLTLGLGIGATTAIFSVVSAVLLQSLPFTEPERIVRIWSAEPARGNPEAAVSIPDFEDWREQNRVFESMGAFSSLASGVILTGRGEAVRLGTTWVSEDFFRALGMRIEHGRAIRPDEHVPGANRVVVLSDRAWRERFGGDPALVGGTIQLNDEPFTVVGIAAPDARFPSAETEAWTPMSLVPESSIPRFRFVRWIEVIGRLRVGTTVEQARAEMELIAARLAREHPEANASYASATVRPLHEHLVGHVRGALLVLFGAVALVLLIAIVNVANLVLARATARAREIAVRSALGAGRGRIVRQLLTESAILALVAGALGVTVAWLGVDALLALSGDWVPSAADVRIDGAVLGFALATSLAAGIGFGIVPALRSASPDLTAALRDGGRGGGASAASHRLRAGLVAVEVALAVTLVVGAGLMMRSFARLVSVEPGFDTDLVLVARFTIPTVGYPERGQYLSVYDRILERVREVPGVVSAGAVKEIPLRGIGEGIPYHVVGLPEPRQGEEPRGYAQPVSDDYFRSMGIPLLAGRDVTPRDTTAASMGVIISESLARRWWPLDQTVGQQIRFVGGAQPIGIIGVVGDVRSRTLASDPPEAIYLPIRLMPRRVLSVVARTAGDPALLAAAVRDAIHSVDPALPIDELTPLRSIVADDAASERFLAVLLATFAVIAMLLAAIGLYGLVTYVVAQRTHEIGVRMALGAHQGAVVRLMLWRGMAPVVAGLVLGVAGAFAMRGALAGLLFGVSPADPATYILVVAMLAAVGLLASWLPARRAAKIEPVTALRIG
ncbi:MAG TPA: ABC transporter permease [Gemmatimonadaceae bacterium]|nr:ABC transporter permease [Gemmatimonadaceae bacterium]